MPTEYQSRDGDNIPTRFLTWHTVIAGKHHTRSVRIGGRRVDDSNPELVAALDRAHAESGVGICLSRIDDGTGLTVRRMTFI